MSTNGSDMPMGYWVNENDPVETTVDNDRRTIAQMQELVPSRFATQAPKPYDKVIYDQCIEIGKKDSVEEGWDCTWLETLCNINLNNLAPQIIGSCVATSHITLLATRMLHEIVLLGQSEELLGRKLSGRDSICPYGPYSYRAGRKFAGINGRGDGSTCAGQIKGTMAHGFLPCDTQELTSDFFPEPKSKTTYREWGAYNTLLSKFQNTAEELDLIEAPEVTSVDQAKSLLQEFKPLQICSGWGFRTTSKRLPNGEVLSSRSGSWAHSMQVQAIVKMTDGNWYVKIRNQWGNYHAGKPYFWVTIEEFGKWLRSASVMAIGEIKQRQSNPIMVWSLGS